jgi:hypothetical protein
MFGHHQQPARRKWETKRFKAARLTIEDSDLSFADTRKENSVPSNPQPGLLKGRLLSEETDRPLNDLYGT